MISKQMVQAYLIKLMYSQCSAYSLSCEGPLLCNIQLQHFYHTTMTDDEKETVELYSPNLTFTNLFFQIEMCFQNLCMCW